MFSFSTTVLYYIYGIVTTEYFSDDDDYVTEVDSKYSIILYTVPLLLRLSYIINFT